MQNAIYKDIPLGVTSHLIDGRMNAGTIISRYPVPLRAAHTLLTMGLRNMEALNVVLVSDLARVLSGTTGRALSGDARPANTPGDPVVDAYVEEHWREYVARWAIDTVGWRCSCGAQIDRFSCTSCSRRYEPTGELLREVVE